MTATAVQAPVPSINIPEAGVSTTQAAQSSSGKSFKDVMQKVQSNQQDTAAKTKPGATATQSATTHDTTASKTQDKSSTEDIEFETRPISDTLRVTDSEGSRAEALGGMFAGLFGIAAADVDYTQSDMDILKDLMGKLRDPAQQFAVMLMMAFLQANPDYQLTDLMQEMPEKMPVETGTSPVTVVMNAIRNMMNKYDDIESFPLFDQLEQMNKSSSPLSRVLFADMMKELNAQVVTQTGGTQGEEDSSDSLLFLQQQYRNAVEEAKEYLANNGKRSTNKVDIEHLQNQVDSGTFLRGFVNIHGTRVSTFFMPTPAELVEQVRSGLMSNLEKGQNEFIMRLQPEGLGSLTVKLTEVAGRMTLTIAAANSQTQRMLEAELPNLREAMKPYQVEVLPVVDSKENAEQYGAYSEQFGEQQAMYQEQDRHGGTHWRNDDEDTVTADIPVWAVPGQEMIDTYI